MNFRNKNVEKTSPAKNVSSFTVTFLAEVLGVEEWFDVTEGYVHLEPPVQGFKLTYSIYPGHSFDLDVVIWPQIAKIFCQGSSGWVRTWLHLGRRWLAFSIRHALRVNVYDLRDHVVIATVKDGLASVTAEAKNTKISSVYLPVIRIGERRQFASVIEDYEDHCSLGRYFRKLLWNLVVDHIPSCHLDGKYDFPSEVSEIRHQDGVLRAVESETFRLSKFGNPSTKSLPNSNIKTKKRSSKTSQDKAKGAIKLSGTDVTITGDKILAGVGYVVSSEQPYGDRAPETIVAMLISSKNLPPSAMHPVFFVNIYKLYDLPEESLLCLGINQIYTSWRIPEEEHSSALFPVSRSISLKDPRAVPLAPLSASALVTSFQDSFLEIEVRGLQILPPPVTSPALFGKTNGDHEYGSGKRAKLKYKELDHLIAVCQVDLKCLILGNKSVRGSFPVLPPKAEHLKIISTATILEATPTLTLSAGLVGCRPTPVAISFSRMLCAPSVMQVANLILEEVFKSNKGANSDDELITGWAVDLDDSIIVFIEGPKAAIEKVYKKALEFQTSNVSYSSNAWYSTRLYAEFMEFNSPVLVLNVHTLKRILTSPKFFNPKVNPVRNALQKLGRLEMCGVDEMWSAEFQPAAAELQHLAKLLTDAAFLKIFE